MKSLDTTQVKRKQGRPPKAKLEIQTQIQILQQLQLLIPNDPTKLLKL